MTYVKRDFLDAALSNRYPVPMGAINSCNIPRHNLFWRRVLSSPSAASGCSLSHHLSGLSFPLQCVGAALLFEKHSS